MDADCPLPSDDVAEEGLSDALASVNAVLSSILAEVRTLRTASDTIMRKKARIPISLWSV